MLANKKFSVSDVGSGRRSVKNAFGRWPYAIQPAGIAHCTPFYVKIAKRQENAVQDDTKFV
ncbi:hypothetical protein Dxin01_04321 [Deinococcus xinjiangensis]|uniref:Uncharacterized protein n=2 Tax=Deinococcus TaxID=1298 RepID=A0ABP9VJV1_9DEIO